MKNFNILDVTLRDGGCRNNLEFDSQSVCNFVKNLDNAGIDFIEVSYIKGSFKRDHFTGMTAHLQNEFLFTISKFSNKLCVMVHPHNIENSDIKDLKNADIKIIRVCVSENNIEKAIDLIIKLKEYKFIVTANIVRITRLSKNTIQNLVEKLHKSEVDIIYIADSNGALVPEKVASVFNFIKNFTDKDLGFHAHNNLNLALANTISALNEGITFVDILICGMGKGAGKLTT